MEWVELKGKGKLSAFTCISVGPPWMKAEGNNRKNPYCSGAVKLDEGVRVDARILGVDTKNPDSIIVGTPLTVIFLNRQGEEGSKTILAFTPKQ